jgi:hypothetical protein
MSLLNVNLQVLSYLDGPRSANPLVRLHDTKYSFLGLCTGVSKTLDLKLNPGETVIAASNLRTLTYTTGTSFTVGLPYGIATLTGSFGQRTGREDGNSTTSWTVSVSNELATLTWAGVGQAPLFGPGYAFSVTLANATVGATYTNNGNTYTLLSTVFLGGVLIMTSGTGAPLPSGTLTLASGVGDPTIAYSSFTAYPGIIPGDGVTLMTPFSPLNQGDFKIVKVGSNYIQYVNPIATGETVITQVDIYSSGPVQIGDTLDITSTAFSYPNQGSFRLTRVTDTFVQFNNPQAVPETVTGVNPGALNIYSDSFTWMSMAVDQRVIVQLNGSADSSVEVEPPIPCDLANNPGLYLKRGKVYQVQVTNPGTSVVNGYVFLAP